ncbi:GNAT family N-acetyltransferase [Phenylobacterium sp.]|uniref:GNAT family N-acetyltransferase n=1 Tax=Phenylobacterium sp. TaxID=1871053 RepID=UPI0039836722
MIQPLIRRAGSADAEALAKIGADTFADTFGHLYPKGDLARFLAQTYSRDRAQAELADPGNASWVVETGGETVGFALAGRCALPHPQVTPECGELKRLYFCKPWQSAGLGGALFGEVLAWLQADGPRDVWIGVWSKNFGAQRFYARQGFEKVGEYGFTVGNTVDREFIFRRSADSFSTFHPKLA